MKTLNQEIAEIKNAKVSLAAKKRALFDLGLTKSDVYLVMADMPAAAPRASFSFGIEIECDVPRNAIAAHAAAHNFNYEYEGYNHRDGQAHFKFVPDGSLRGDNPIECVSPVLKSSDGKKTVKACCDTLADAGVSVNRTCGFHVHISAPRMTNQQYVNTFANYRMLESVIDTFMAPSRRGNLSDWCRTLTDHSFESCNTPEDVRRELRCDRYHKVNAESYCRHKTIEFRQHQGTANYDKIMNWVSFCGKLVVWSKSNRLTQPISSIDEIPFLSRKEKAFFARRANEFNRASDAA